jgi:hypothetical protein
MPHGLPPEAVQQVLSGGSTPYEASALAEVLNLEISAFDVPHSAWQHGRRPHGEASPPSGAPSDRRAMPPGERPSSPSARPTSPGGRAGAPSGGRAPPSARPTSPGGRAGAPSGGRAPPSAQPTSPGGRAGAPSGGRASPGLIPARPSRHPTILPEGHETWTTTCGADRREQQICRAADAFCYAPNYHCCGPATEPEFCPGRVAQPAAPTRGELAVACLRSQAACSSGDHDSCVLSASVCGAARASLRT